MSIEGPRILDKAFAGAVVTNDALEPPSPNTASVDGVNWEKLTDSCFVTRTYYDLSGYTRDDLTSFFAGVDIQEEFQPHGSIQCYIIDLVTTESMTTAQITGAHFDDPGATLDLPGFPRSTFDQNQVIYGRTRTYNTSTSFVTGNIAEYGRTNWGTCAAATVEKLYMTRIIYTDPAVIDDLTLTIPPANYVTSAIIAKEPDLVYLMRQKRSYEIATQ